MFMYRSPFGLPLKQSAEKKRCAGLHRTREPKFPLHREMIFVVTCGISMSLIEVLIRYDMFSEGQDGPNSAAISCSARS